MSVLHAIWRVLLELAGDAEYCRYCAHMRSRHPEQRLPSEREFYLSRLKDKYTRPTRCC